MLVNGSTHRTVRSAAEGETIQIIDQSKLPWSFQIEDLRCVSEVATAISEMHVRGAGCIGATAGYGMWLAAKQARGSDERLLELAHELIATRPTASNLRWAVERQLTRLRVSPVDRWVAVAKQEAENIADEDAAWCQRIGEHGCQLLREIASQKPPGEPVHILTHCNAGWLAFTDWGSATAPIYAAHRAGIPVHVWVDETRPRNQGARLTAWELMNEKVPHTVIVDNAGGHLMQHGMVDLVITGTDRTTYTGDVANKIGTYLKALAAHDNGIPFYVALPSSTFDWKMRDGVREIPIEERGGSEVSLMDGLAEDGSIQKVGLVNPGSPTANHAFDVTPARLVTGLITERGICAASEDGISRLYPPHERAPH
jgi:methylthioribose-1-phosphate isomerase